MIAKMGLCCCTGSLLGSFVPGHFWIGTIGGAALGLVAAWFWTAREVRS